MSANYIYTFKCVNVFYVNDHVPLFCGACCHMPCGADLGEFISPYLSVKTQPWAQPFLRKVAQEAAFLRALINGLRKGFCETGLA